MSTLFVLMEGSNMTFIHKEFGVLTNDLDEAISYCKNCIKHGIPISIYSVDSHGIIYVPEINIQFKKE